MKRGIRGLREWIFAGTIMTLVLGVGIAARQMVGRLQEAPLKAAIGSNVPNKPGTGSEVVPPSVDPGTPLPGKSAPNFHLTDQFGTKGSLSDFRGKVVILSFIDGKCTTVCPLTAVVLQNVHYDLGSSASNVAFVAINANPVATSVKDIFTWSKEHHVLNMWHFFTGSASQLKDVYSKYYVQSTVLGGTNIEHTPAVYVIGPNGHERWVYLNSDQSSTPVIGTETQDILKQVIPLIPGHPKVSIPPSRQLAYLPGNLGPSNVQNRSFHLPAILPNGQNGSVTVGNGGKPKLLEFFATWCPDCEEEIPSLVKFQQWSTNHSQFPSVVGVDLRLSESSTEHVRNYVKKFNLPFPVALDNHDNVANMYDVNGIPTQVLVSSSGHILWYHQGLIGWSEMKVDVEHALNGK